MRKILLTIIGFSAAVLFFLIPAKTLAAVFF